MVFGWYGTVRGFTLISVGAGRGSCGLWGVDVVWLFFIVVAVLAVIGWLLGGSG